ncbi:hypothetical protein C3B47_13925 [Flavobacterium columnare]|uniref:RHS repeat domain-containing protein n=1 Tax=Flavobacterium columnare TaxID=996 RepID=UPI00293BC2CB|nr:RHS repeat-associated core domain-containing protein [Flavobacterium columnare]MBF6653953.1 hypothetical protein [Flavobacterium columnare]
MLGEEVYSIINDYLGTPVQAYNSNGKLIWERELDIYGKTRKIEGDQNLIPFLYQGQYYDHDIELAYNRFRYYNPETGTYISQDPLFLEGSMNVYSYVYDSNSRVDPFGLSDCSFSDLDKKAIEAWDVLPNGKGKNMTTVAVGKGQSGELYVSTSQPYTPKAIKDWAKANDVNIVNSKTTDVHAEESLHNFSGEKITEIGSSKPICKDCENGMIKNKIDFNQSNTKGSQSTKRKLNGNTGLW